MSSKQRIGLLAIAAMIAIAAFIAMSPGDDNDTEPNRAAQPQQQATTSSTPEATTSTQATTPTKKKPPAPPLLTAAKVTELEAEKGETVTFRARSTQDDEVHVHGYDISKDAPAGKTVRMSFKATIEGIFEIEFEHAGTEIAKLTVEP